MTAAKLSNVVIYDVMPGDLVFSDLEGRAVLIFKVDTQV
jgi:hypothetical protein